MGVDQRLNFTYAITNLFFIAAGTVTIAVSVIWQAAALNSPSMSPRNSSLLTNSHRTCRAQHHLPYDPHHVRNRRWSRHSCCGSSVSARYTSILPFRDSQLQRLRFHHEGAYVFKRGQSSSPVSLSLSLVSKYGLLPSMRRIISLQHIHKPVQTQSKLFKSEYIPHSVAY